MECHEAYIKAREVYWPAFDLDYFKKCGLVKKDTLCEDSCSGPFEKDVHESRFELVGPDPKDSKKTIVLAASDYVYHENDL